MVVAEIFDDTDTLRPHAQACDNNKFTLTVNNVCIETTFTTLNMDVAHMYMFIDQDQT